MSDLSGKVFLMQIEKHLKKNGANLTLSQKILLLQELGILDKVNELPVLQKSKNKLLAALLSAHEKNVEQDINELSKGQKSALYTKANLKKLIRLYKDLGFPEKADQAEKELMRIEAKG